MKTGGHFRPELTSWSMCDGKITKQGFKEGKAVLVDCSRSKNNVPSNKHEMEF